MRAILIGPPTIVKMMSIAANKPFRVRFKSSAVSSLIFRCSERLWKPANRLYSLSAALSGGKISTQASPMALRTLVRLSPMFLKPARRCSRPDILSISDRSCSTVLPLFLASCCRMRSILISSAVNPSFVNSASDNLRSSSTPLAVCLLSSLWDSARFLFASSALVFSRTLLPSRSLTAF